MLRIKDPKASLDFYENVLGMDLVDTLQGSDFTLYFLGYRFQKDVPRGQREGLLELTHNHGTESDPNFAYHNGNVEPRGFGHIAVSVDNIEAACERFEKLGVRWQKRLTDGRMKTIGEVLTNQRSSLTLTTTGLKSSLPLLVSKVNKCLYSYDT